MAAQAAARLAGGQLGCSGPVRRAQRPSAHIRARSVSNKVVCTAAAEETRQASTSTAVAVNDAPHAGVPQQPDALTPQPGRRIAVLKATKVAAQAVEERARPLEEYMTLPASQYSLLDAQRVERLDDSTFRCYVGGLQFLGLQVEPVITVQVTVEERGPTVRLLSAKLQGSKVVQAANDKFTATMCNVVRWQEATGSSASNNAGGKEIVSDTSIQVTLEVPSWFFLPVSSIERTGGAVMARVLESAVPRFLKQLAADYELWAEGGDDSLRSEAAAGGSLLDLEEVNSPDDS